MNCRKPGELDLYLDNEMDDASARVLENHLDACPSCRAALEQRKALLADFRSLPDIALPPDFTDRVMARVFPERRGAFAWLVALVGSLTGLFLGGLAYAILAGRSLPGLAIEAGKSVWDSGREGILILAKAGKLFAVSVQLTIQFAGDLLAMLKRFGALIDTRIYAALAITLIAVSAFIYLGIKRRTANGEKP